MKLIIVSNRLPLSIVEGKKEYRVIASTGGLATGLDSLEVKGEKLWVGWPGIYLDGDNRRSEREKVNEQLKRKNFYPVYLTPRQTSYYYEGYSNSILWPLCHYFPSYIRYESKYWETYKEVNALFCEAVAAVLEEGDIVWVQDYHLMLLPQLLRERCPNVIIGYFHHIPFPSYEMFRTLPERSELLNGLLGADLVGFHTHSYMQHFISAVFRVLKLNCVLDEIHLDSRVAYVDAFPMGINYDKYHNAIRREEVRKKARQLIKTFGHARLILSIDRLDYSKGILMRLRSVENFLEYHPEYRGRVSLVMVVAPSRDNVEAYAGLKKEIDRKVGAINGKYSTVHWRPVYYFYRSFGFEDLIPLYYISEVAMVTPLRDGMNLVAKEYLAVKRKKSGVLILSEMAGAAVELSEAITVNPSDCREIENAIVQALEMPEKERKKALRAMQDIIATQTVDRWAADFIRELRDVRAKNEALGRKIIKEENFASLKALYDKARHRLILLDYDGTLAPFHKEPKKALPSPELKLLLRRLAADPNNRVVISSGRDRHTLERWLGDLAIGLSAEHGAFYKEGGKWYSKLRKATWDNELLDILQQTVRRTPHSELEIKDTAIVWHYRNVDSWAAEMRVPQLVNALLPVCQRHNMQVMQGNKIVEVKPAGIGKGAEALRLLECGDYDFVLAMGDDTTDEDMFRALPSAAVTIKVGSNSSMAKYNIPGQQDVLAFLSRLQGTV